MKKRYAGELTDDELAAMSDEDIDFSDVPERDEEWLATAELIEPDRTRPVTLRIKKSVIDAFKAEGRGYQTRMNLVLESYARSRLNRD